MYLLVERGDFIHASNLAAVKTEYVVLNLLVGSSLMEVFHSYREFIAQADIP